MKKILFLGLVFANVASATVPAFIKEGNVYAFSLAGRSNTAESALAKVETIDPSGWLEISLVQKGEHMWINLAQVQVVMPSKYEAKAVRETLIRNKVTENLRKITVQIDEFWVRENKKPSSVSEAFGITNGYIPLTVEDGEDYSALDISGDRPLTIKTKSGYEIRYTRKNP